VERRYAGISHRPADPVSDRSEWMDIYFKGDIAQEARARVLVAIGVMIGVQPPFALAWEKKN
jgi:hypothetical protein